ncbi:hypothetical protein AB1Y20_014015 [Prymnesium parvum]|uniref:Ammonium transporter AmtB-like domain-containing protein n=1 Tax=Prymnesium parvum TaxID=97485 RepID=A0AB34IH39_PRYPA
MSSSPHLVFPPLPNRVLTGGGQLASCMSAACDGNFSCLVAQVAQLERALSELSDCGAAQDTAWVLTCGALVFLMQLGFAMLEAGAVREQNVIATYMKNLLDLLLGTLAGVFFGYYLANGVHPLNIGAGAPGFEQRSFFFYTAFQSTAATIVSGAVAERMSIIGYSILSILMSGFVYAMAVRLTWGGGWLLDRGFHDFAGSGVVHALGGAAALVSCYVVGPRHDRWDPQSANLFAPQSVPSVLSGTLILWVGWYGFNSGSTTAMSSADDARVASNAALVTTIGACAGGCTALLLSLAKTWYTRDSASHDILTMANGVLAGLVSITAGCDAIDAKWAIPIGALGAVACDLGVRLRVKLKIDDVVDAFAVHCCAGVWGVVAVGLFHYERGLFISGDGEQLGWQLVGAILLVLLGSVPVGVVVVVLRRFELLRVSEDDETKGLDHLFGLTAYAQTDKVLQHLTAIDGILRSYGYQGTLIQALEAVDSHACIMRAKETARHDAPAGRPPSSSMDYDASARPVSMQSSVRHALPSCDSTRTRTATASKRASCASCFEEEGAAAVGGGPNVSARVELKRVGSKQAMSPSACQLELDGLPECEYNATSAGSSTTA